MSDFQNYFNYFTEIEDHFRRTRGTSLFLLSPLDWALIESWKTSGIPLIAVLRGIDAAFEKWKVRRNKSQMVNSLAFCSQAVLKEAQRAPGAESATPPPEPFSNEEVTGFLQSNLEILRDLDGFDDIANGLAGLLAGNLEDLADLDQHLSVLEQKMIAIARASETGEDSLAAKRELESQLQPYRRKMSAPQLDMLERQFLERKLLETRKLPRLSLFYLR